MLCVHEHLEPDEAPTAEREAEHERKRLGAPRAWHSPQKPENFAATIYDALGIPRGTHWKDLAGRPYPVYHADPIGGLT